MVLTPVGHDGLYALELGGALGRLRELQLLELDWSDTGHGCGYAMVLRAERGCFGGGEYSTWILGSPRRAEDAVIGTSV